MISSKPIKKGQIQEFTPADYDLADFNNASLDPFARVSDIGGGTGNYIFDTNSVSATLPFGFVILKEYNIGKLSELNAIQLYFTLQTLGNSAEGYIQIIDSSNNIVLSNYLNLAASNFIYNYSREHFIIDKLNNKIKFIDVQNSSDTTAIGTYAYANITFNPLEDYKVRFSIRTLGSDPTILEHVMINLL